jgi:hypothetical protein
MDRLWLNSDPYAVDDRRAVAIEPERSDRVALLQMVEAGGSFGPLMESLGDESELAVQGDVERSGRPIGRIRNLHHRNRARSLRRRCDDGQRIQMMRVWRPAFARLVDSRHHIDIRQHEDGPAVIFGRLSA